MELLILGPLGLLWLIVIIWAIIRTAGSSAGPIPKFFWILILLFFPLFGFLLWLLLGPKR
jgi:hypothetical protein